MIFENEDLNAAIEDNRRITRNEPDFKISTHQIFVRNMALMNNAYDAAIAAGVPDDEAEEFAESAMNDPMTSAYINYERNRIAMAERLMTLDGITGTLTEIIMVARAILPDPSIAMSFEPGRAPPAAYGYNPMVALKALETLVKVKEAERRGVNMEGANSSAAQAAMREIMAEVNGL